MKTAVRITINGEPYEATVENRLLLVDFTPANRQGASGDNVKTVTTTYTHAS